jgi:hypothetical protein
MKNSTDPFELTNAIDALDDAAEQSKGLTWLLVKVATSPLTEEDHAGSKEKTGVERLALHVSDKLDKARAMFAEIHSERQDGPGASSRRTYPKLQAVESDARSQGGGKPRLRTAS